MFRIVKMKTITIGDCVLEIKDYYCDDGGGYLLREDSKLWLYINIGNVCNAHCPFCINPCRAEGSTPFNITSFTKTLYQIKDHISGISITGGEPMLFPELVDRVIGVVTEVFDRYIEKDIVTNGFNFSQINDLKHLTDLDSIHLSRHMIDDAENSRVFGISVAAAEEIKYVVSNLSDPAKVVLNCILMKNGVCSVETIAEYLEFAADNDISNTSFIGMAPANRFCIENFVDPASFDLSTDPRFRIWNGFRDHEFCKCSSGSYQAENRPVRFYYRCIGTERAPYARQLVYTADNKLLAGFNGKEIHLDQNETI